MPETDLQLLTHAARAAGDIARGYVGMDPQVWDKSDGAGPVTEADLAVNVMLHEMLCTARPDYGWLSEETEDGEARLRTTRQFVIDPIDGTRAFIEGSRDWAHSLAVTEDGAVIAAAVYLPMRDMMFTASLGGGAQLNGAVIGVSNPDTLSSAHVLAARPNLDPSFWRHGQVPEFKRGFRSSLAYRLCLVAQGRFDAMLTLRPTWEWDIAAGALIVAEAGGSASDRKGARLLFNNTHPQVDGIVAGGSTHHMIISELT